MPTYQSEETLTEHLRIAITPAMRLWLEEKAKDERRSINSIIRMMIEFAMTDKTES